MLPVHCGDIAIHSNIDLELQTETAGKCVTVCAHWNQNDEPKPVLELRWALPLVDIQYEWYPSCGKDRSLRVDWSEGVKSKISSSAPVYCFYNAAGRNRFTLALSDVLTETDCALGVREEDGTLLCVVKIPLDATGATDSYRVTLYRDYDDVSFAEVLRRVSAWWEQDCGYAPMSVPDAAKLPMYSCWYSFHQATIAHEIEAECARAAAIGMNTVIVDDGWQTDDGNRGYGFCGDWQVTPNKIPDMKAHVQAVHDLGMKYMLWYSVPFVGEWAGCWERFKDKLLAHDLRMHAGVLDPRWPDVREYLITTYVEALKEWNLDGFKLDFIDSFRPDHPLTFEEGMDYASVEDAVLRLMTDVMDALKAIKPEILIEFRQSYIGPAMRTFGNMFRVGDCPADPLSNRVGVLDLRLLSGSTAVHSDMLMWHKDDTAEAAARQILSIIFGVAQISVKLDVITEEHKKMVAFWLKFMADNRALLQDAPIEVESPQDLYPLAMTRKGSEAAIAVYSAGHMAKIPADCEKVILLNATAEAEIQLKFAQNCAYDVDTLNCLGEKTGSFMLEANSFSLIDVPVSGMAVLVKK